MKTCTRFPGLGWGGLLAVLSFLPEPLVAQEVTVELTNGSVLTVTVESIDSGSLSFRSGESRSTARLDYGQIESVEWPETPAWVAAEGLFLRERFREAASAFEAITKEKSREATYYPAPGNFATLAHLRLLQCLRRLADAEGIARHFDSLEVDKLPAAERELPPVFEAWAAAGAEDWDRVSERAAALVGNDGAASQAGIEAAYLHGLALEHSGRWRESLISYAGAYTLNAATDEQVSRLALQRSIELLEARETSLAAERDERRQEAPDLHELRAQVKLYASLFGRGQLFEGAGPLAVGMLGGSLDAGEDALGQNARNRAKGEMASESQGVDLIEQVTADHMKKVQPKRDDSE